MFTVFIIIYLCNVIKQLFVIRDVSFFGANIHFSYSTNYRLFYSCFFYLLLLLLTMKGDLKSLIGNIIIIYF